MPVRKMKERLLKYLEEAGSATIIAQLESMTDDEIKQLCEDTFGPGEELSAEAGNA